MTTYTRLLVVYVLGGLTFLPLIFAVILCHAYLTLPQREAEQSSEDSARDRASTTSKSEDASDVDLGNLPEELKRSPHKPDVAAGYFAVCREYVPGGVNGKPPERTTPAGAVVAAESPSVYQSMYRSIFDRNKSQIPTMEGGKATGKAVKKARNVFYVVLRHGHLMLYDDSEQLEVRHVISLEHYDVDIYAGGERIPEGELFIKRNCIRLTRKRIVGEIESDSKPFYLFSDNTTEKEDFYHALLQNQERRPGSSDNPPLPLRFEQAHVVKLVQQLHATEDNLQTRWLNALIGRVFLALYKTTEVEDFIRMKITKKIARVPKPNFINSIKLQRVDMGDSAPLITNPKLKELTVDGDVTVEADVRYNGNFQLEIAAVARIELGSRIKAREVNLILAGILKKLEGHILIRIKPPPSNRLWISFETMPKLEMSIEPIVSSRQITYGIILRAIESRIREVVGDTLVLPNWDDVPFHDTMLQRFRGGIWADDVRIKPIPDHQTAAAEQGLVDQVDRDSDSDEADTPPPPAATLTSREKTMSMPSLFDTPPVGLTPTKKKRSSVLSLDGGSESAVSSGTDTRAPSGKPRAMRSHSFASAASPVVSTDAATVEAIKDQARKGQQDAAAAMKDLSSRSSQPGSPTESPVGSFSKPSLMEQAKKSSSSSTSSQASKTEDTPAESSTPSTTTELDPPPDSPRRQSTASASRTSLESTPASTPSIASTSKSNKSQKSLAAARSLASAEKRQALNASLTSATAAAKKWGLGFVNRHAPSGSSTAAAAPSTPSTNDTTPAPATTSPTPHTPTPTATPSPSTLGPIGRGQPLPPPGTPLPGPPKPEKSGWAGVGVPFSGIGLAKRKPVPSASRSASTTASKSSAETKAPTPPALPARPGQAQGSPALTAALSAAQAQQKPPSPTPSAPRPVPKPPLPARRRRVSVPLAEDAAADGSGEGDGVFVVAAPAAEESAPSSPVDEKRAEGDELGEDERQADRESLRMLELQGS